MVTRIFLLLLLSPGWLLAGCSSLLVASTPPPVFYGLDYAPLPTDCPSRFSEGVRGWTFSASSPYDRPAMVVAKRGGERALSGSFQWVAPPGKLLSQHLMDDLSRSALFPRVVSEEAPDSLPLQLTGHLFDFSCRRDGAEARAVLDAEVSVAGTGSSAEALFHHRYRIESEPFDGESSAAFAAGMASAVRELSAEFSRDLCRKAASAAAGPGK